MQFVKSSNIFSKMKEVGQKYPNISKGLLIGTLLSISDNCAQLLFQKQYSWRRNFQFFVLGFCWMAPVIQTWYGFILPKITSKYLSHLEKTPAIFARTIIDNLIFPPISYAGFYLIRNFLLRQSHQRANLEQEFKTRYIPTILVDWAVWVPANFLNFWFVSVPWQGVFVGVLSLFFNIILSYIANKDNSKTNKQETLHKELTTN